MNPDIVAKFSERYDSLMKEKGYPLLSIMATGGGMDLSSLLTYPGSSSRIAAITHPYSMDELWHLVSPIVRQKDLNAKKEDWRSVHAESAEIYLRAMRASRLQEYFLVASTAALETNRRRKGKNVSYVATQIDRRSPVRVWEILLEKPEDNMTFWCIVDECGTIPWDIGSEERWKTIFAKNGHISNGTLAAVRNDQDCRISNCVLQIILDDKEFYPHLLKGEKITLLSEGSTNLNQVWLEGRGRA